MQPNKPAVPSKPPQAPRKSNKPPVVRVEKVKCSCGHLQDFEVFGGKQDKFREERRKKATGKPCKECVQKAHHDKTTKEQDEAKKRRIAKYGPTGKRPQRVRPDPGRLPNGATFFVKYDHDSSSWTGTLGVTMPDGKFGNFDGTASGVFKLLSTLDTKYRVALSEVRDWEKPAE